MFKKGSKISKDEASILSKRTTGEKILFVIMFGVFSLYAIALVFPLILLIINSLKDPLYKILADLNGISPFALPDVWHFENYIEVFGYQVASTSGKMTNIAQMFLYSLYFSVTQVLIPVFTCTCVGYVLSKYEFKGSNFIYAVIITTMTIPVVGTGASALKLAHDLGTYDNPIMDIITHFTGYGFNFMVMYGFFKNVSWSYAEAVLIDGGDDFDAFFKVMLPQATSAIITICIISFISVWNNYERPLIYFPSYPPLAAGLYMLKREAMNDANAPFYFAGLVFATLPLCVVYAMFSETIFKNFSVGGLKG